MVNKKRLYIDDVVRSLGISRKTYYNWEKAGKVPKPQRDPMNNYRIWTEVDLKKLKKLTGRI